MPENLKELYRCLLIKGGHVINITNTKEMAQPLNCEKIIQYFIQVEFPTYYYFLKRYHSITQVFILK